MVKCRLSCSMALAQHCVRHPLYSWSHPKCIWNQRTWWSSGGRLLFISGYVVSFQIVRSPSQKTVRMLGWRWYFIGRAVSCVFSWLKSLYFLRCEHSRKCQLSSGSLWQEGHSCVPGCGWNSNVLSRSLLCMKSTTLHRSFLDKDTSAVWSDFQWMLLMSA